MANHDPWDSYEPTPEPSLLEKILIAIVALISMIFFHNDNHNGKRK